MSTATTSNGRSNEAAHEAIMQAEDHTSAAQTRSHKVSVSTSSGPCMEVQLQPAISAAQTPMTRAAKDAALGTLAAILSERNPGQRFMPLSRDVGANGSVASPTSGQVVWAVASPEDGHPILNRNSTVSARDKHCVD